MYLGIAIYNITDVMVGSSSNLQVTMKVPYLVNLPLDYLMTFILSFSIASYLLY